MRNKHIVLIVTLMLILTGAFFTFTARQQGISITPPEFHQGSGDIVVNMSDGENDFYRSQITAPQSYFVTSGSMLDRYDSQGGIASPRLILMKGYQVTGSESYYKAVTNNPENQCIAIWTTGGFSSIDDWSAVTGFTGEVKDKTEIPVGDRTAGMQTRILKDRLVYEGYLRVSTLRGGVTYYFNSCNTKNKSDFIKVMQSLKLRADISL